METLSQQITVMKGETFRGLFSFNTNNNDSANNIPAPITVSILGTGDSTSGDSILYGDGSLYPPNTTAGWINPTWPYYPITVQPTTTVPTVPVITIQPIGPAEVYPFTPPYPPSTEELTEGLIKRLEELLERAKQQKAAAATPAEQSKEAPPAEDDSADADVDAARFRRLEPNKDV